MIEFEKELKKFKPVLEIDQIENGIQENDVQDIVDILKEVIAKMEDRGE
jgi:hypothetical protein